MDNRIERIVILGGGTAGWITVSYLAKMLGDTTSVTVLEAPSIPKIGVGEATAMGDEFDYYYHLFDLLPECDRFPFLHYWAYLRLRGETKERFDYSYYWEPSAMKVLCWLGGRPATFYAWHFDANLVDRHGGDLFIDCSGFRGLLINKSMVEPFTPAIAMKTGGTWKITMLGRFGTGYVYSSRFTDQDEATKDFCKLWDLDAETTSFNVQSDPLPRRTKPQGVGQKLREHRVVVMFPRATGVLGNLLYHGRNLPAGQVFPRQVNQPVRQRDRDHVR